MATVSLANLDDGAYLKIGGAIRKTLDEFHPLYISSKKWICKYLKNEGRLFASAVLLFCLSRGIITALWR